MMGPYSYWPAPSRLILEGNREAHTRESLTASVTGRGAGRKQRGGHIGERGWKGASPRWQWSHAIERCGSMYLVQCERGHNKPMRPKPRSSSLDAATRRRNVLWRAGLATGARASVREFARQAQAKPTLIAAALLHDIGHLLHDLPENVAATGIDTRHEDAGCHWLMARFGAAVAEPVRCTWPLSAIFVRWTWTISRDSLQPRCSVSRFRGGRSPQHRHANPRNSRGIGA